MGTFSLWRGASLLFLRDSIFNITRFGMLEISKERLMNKKKFLNYEDDFNLLSSKGQQKRVMEQFRAYTWANVLATIPAAIISTPFDVVKTRVMTCPPSEKQSIRNFVRDIVKDEGFFTLFRGAGLRTCYIACLISLFTSLEFYLNIPVQEAARINQMARGRDDLFK
jgi:hypothetical protein